jgi:hypothetical protein
LGFSLERKGSLDTKVLLFGMKFCLSILLC